MTQQQLADKLKVSFQAVSNWEPAILLSDSLWKNAADKAGSYRRPTTFIEQIMKPHTPYYKAVKELFGQGISPRHGSYHRGGIEGNLCRIIPDGLTAEISLPQIRPLPVFKYIKLQGNVEG